MVAIEFWGGLGVIGGSKIMIEDGGHRVLLDIGLDIPSGRDPFRRPVQLRPGRELSDRLRMNAAPRIPGLFDPAARPRLGQARRIDAGRLDPRRIVCRRGTAGRGARRPDR
ncbi:hypothetical protein GXW82_26875 [Streptacidiphilus sp. 4-A2]|nr:hypothetical protein [Streptacidiphilus sp. 4-A2]